MICNTPTISTIIPVFNAAKYIEEAIESVLAQNVTNHELVLLNDGSTDRSAEILNKYKSKATVIHSSNRGTAITLNEAVKLSNGEFLTFLDADDIWLPDKLNLQLASFNKDTELDCCFGHINQFISPELPIEIQSRFIIPTDPQPGYNRQSLMVKRKSFIKVGYFDEALKTGEFIDWYLRAKSKNLKMNMLSEVVTNRRIHDKSMGSSHDHDSQFAIIMKRHLDRKRNH